MNKGKKEN